MEDGHSHISSGPASAEAHADDTRPLVYAAGVAGLIALAMGAYTAALADWFASGMAFVGGLVLVGGMAMELRRRT